MNILKSVAHGTENMFGVYYIGESIQTKDYESYIVLEKQNLLDERNIWQL
jgi:hypothetical protein